MSLKLQHETVETCPYGDDLLLYHLPTGSLYLLNNTGKFIWEELESGQDSTIIAERLARRYDVSPDKARQDVQATIYQWKEAGLFAEPKSIPPLQSQPYPFCTERTNSHSPHNHLHFSLGDSFCLAGKTLQVYYREEQLQQFFRDIFPHLLTTDKTIQPDLSVKLWRENGSTCAVIGDRLMRTTGSIDLILSWIVAEFVDKTYRKRGCLAVLHSGAVGYAGRGIVVAGASGSGKSTLVAALQQAGFSYLSDDVCPLSLDTGEIIPVPISQSIKKGSWELLEKSIPSFKKQIAMIDRQKEIRYLPPQVGGMADWKKPWPVETIIFPEYHPQAPTELSPISPLKAILSLIHTGSLCGNSFRNFFNWVEAKQSYTLTYSSLEDATEVIIRNCL